MWAGGLAEMSCGGRHRHVTPSPYTSQLELCEADTEGAAANNGECEQRAVRGGGHRAGEHQSHTPADASDGAVRKYVLYSILMTVTCNALGRDNDVNKVWGWKEVANRLNRYLEHIEE